MPAGSLGRLRGIFGPVIHLKLVVMNSTGQRNTHDRSLGFEECVDAKTFADG
jgi:hypothetical protein